jgi:hypothetical protein
MKDKIKKEIINTNLKIDKALNKYDNQILFPKKLEKANMMLKIIGLPKQLIN